MTAQRSATLTVGAAVTAMIILVFFFKAPLLPVAAGTLISAAWLSRRIS